jgi:hypothetical protein
MNPSESDHRASVRKLTKDVIGFDNKPLDAILWGVSREVVNVKDYFFFSLTYIGNVRVGYGLLGKVILKDKLILVYLN